MATKYIVTRKDGTVLKPGDKLTNFRGEAAYFAGCYHPRKVCVKHKPTDSDTSAREYYPNVYDLTITEA